MRREAPDQGYLDGNVYQQALKHYALASGVVAQWGNLSDTRIPQELWFESWVFHL